MSRWETACAKYGSDEETDLLKRGWEPFGVVSEEESCDGDRYERTYVYFRKESEKDKEPTK